MPQTAGTARRGEAFVLDPEGGEAYARVLIDAELTSSGWNALDTKQVRLEVNTRSGRVDYVLFDRLGRALCVLEAKRQGLDPYDAKEQARAYAENLKAPFVLLSNGSSHWFWNYDRTDHVDAQQVERFPSPSDLERMRLRNLQPPLPLATEPVDLNYLANAAPDLEMRGYQVSALNLLAQQFDEGRRHFLFEMATGTGKTLVCAALIRRFLRTRNAERVLFIVDRIELANQAMEDFNRILPEYSPVIYKSARHTGELLGSSVVVATIQSLMIDRRYKREFSPFYFDLVVSDEAHRSIYGDSRQAIQYFQATRLGLTATPKAYLKNVDTSRLGDEDPKALEARQLRDTYHYFGCQPGEPTFRYDIVDAVKDPEGPFLCLPKIIDCRSDITTQALQDAGWTVLVNEVEENYKVKDLERTIFTPHRNRVMCETFLREAQLDPSGRVGRSIIFAVNQKHATEITKTLNVLRPSIAVTITSRIKDAASIAKDFRDGRRKERVAVSVDMLSTGYNCRDLLNIVLMRPIFSPTEYVQIKGRGTRLYTFTIGNTEYDKRNFFLIDFCAVAEYFEEDYDYTAPLPLPASDSRRKSQNTSSMPHSAALTSEGQGAPGAEPRREIPVWEGTDRLLSREVRIVGPNGEKVDAMTFRGSFERDLKAFATRDDDMAEAIATEDDARIETLLQERFFHLPTMYYSADKLVVSYGVPAPTPAFVYSALGKKALPTRDTLRSDVTDSLSARFNLRYSEQKWLEATVRLVTEDAQALDDFLSGRYSRLFTRSQFRTLGGLHALAAFENREEVFESLRQTTLIESSRLSMARVA